MNWFFQPHVLVPTLLILGVLVLLAPLFMRRSVERRLGRVDAPPRRRAHIHPFPVRRTGISQLPRPARNSASAHAAAERGEGIDTAQGARGDGLAHPEYRESPTPFAIVADVCSLHPPAREDAEQSYKGKDVRWKLRLAGISEGIERGPVRSVRMYPDARSAQGCGIYFVVNLEEHPELQAARKDETFVVEGTIETVSGMDIDLKNIHKVQKVA